MMNFIIKDLSKKLKCYIEEKGGSINVDSNWVNDWLKKHDAEFVAIIVDKDGNEIKGGSVLIKNNK